MSHMVNITVGDTQMLRQIRVRLTEEVGPRSDELEVAPWLNTLDYILRQTEEDEAQEDACGDTYAVLDELRDELISASCEPAGDTREGRDQVRRLYEDIDAVIRVRKLVQEIVDPRRR